LAESQDHRQRIISDFCDRFGANSFEMNELLASPNNWWEYQLYSAFNAHTQLELGLNDHIFFEQMADRTFKNYQDGLIKLSRFIPLKFVLDGMSKQF
jgi:hypothetical protein